MTPLEYWSSGQGLRNITPRGKPWPEGEDFGTFIAALVGPQSTVLEFGCGIGRLAGLFTQENYLGVDICDAALVRARHGQPARRFRVIGENSPLPVADVTLVHTVLLHIPDDRLTATVSRFHSRRVIVSEILGRAWRREGNPPVFNREQHEYATAFEPRYSLTQAIRRPYPHYAGVDMTVMEFERC